MSKMKQNCIAAHTVVNVELVDVLVTTFTVDGGVVVTVVDDVNVVLSLVVSLLTDELLPADVFVCAVVSVDDGMVADVDELILGTRESTTPTGPVKSASFWHVNSSGCIE